MLNKNLDLIAINSLLGEKFFVPHYQRGYRWTKKEVKALLEDILQFFIDNQNSPKEAFYCLQPLVVTKSNDNWILVDGQQRLTTIFLILSSLEEGMKFLEKEKYSLSYATRPNSEDFLNRIKEVKEEEKLKNIDFYHMWEAFQAIVEWFSEKKGSVKMPVLNTLLNDDFVGKNVKVIWYEINDKDSIEVFTRINMGKIPLTNSELIKALFLRKNNFNLENDEYIYLRQIEIASEWDRIENTLQNDSFWYFIHDNQIKYDTRIEFIFDLMKNRLTSNDEYFTFISFNKDFETNKNKNDIWLNVKEYFMRLEEWYNDKILYHLVGYLITTGSKINEILEKSKDLSKIDFKEYLHAKIKEKIKNVELDDISYGDKRIKNILLLFNIETILNTEKSNIRFPFDEYKKENWDIEHISSVMSEIPTLGKSRKWLENIFEYFNGSTVLDHYEKTKPEVDKIVKDVNDLLKKDSYLESEFNTLYHEILKYFKEDYKQKEGENDSFTNSLGNLTLLDSHTNRSYKNAVFPVKRKRILKNDMDGLFVPICTKNVFLKYYSEKLDDVMFWQKSDAKTYLSKMKITLKPYL